MSYKPTGSSGGFPGASGARMTFDRFKLIASRVDLRMFPIPILIKVDEDVMCDRVIVLVRYKATVDRADGRPTDIISRNGFEWSKLEHFTDDDVVDLLFKEVERAVVHELAECFLVCGQRVRDPHWNEGTYDIGAQPPFELPDPLPPELPKKMQLDAYHRRGETIKVIGRFAPSLSAGFNPRENLTAPVYEYLATGELVRRPDLCGEQIVEMVIDDAAGPGGKPPSEEK